jgi:hypothetical protein
MLLMEHIQNNLMKLEDPWVTFHKNWKKTYKNSIYFGLLVCFQEYSLD